MLDLRFPWREPVRGGYPDPILAELSGRERLRSMLSGDTPRPPISRLTGMQLTAESDTTATFEMPLSQWLCSSQGAISIGPLTMPADGAMGCALQTVLPPGTAFVTSELSLRVLRPAAPGGRVLARGRVIEARRTIGLAEVEITDEAQRLIAHGSTLWLIQPSGATPATEPAPEDPARAPGTKVPPQSQDHDPWQSSPPPTTLGQEVWDRMSGLEVLQAQLADALPMPPIHFLTGLTLRAAAPGTATFSMPASEWLCAPRRGRVQGGAVALLAESALSSALQTKLPPGTALAPVDLKINYLRPLAADGRDALAIGRAIHGGRRTGVASAEVLDADRRPIAVATGSAMFLPGRRASLR